jgi:hypothetical protein
MFLVRLTEAFGLFHTSRRSKHARYNLLQICVIAKQIGYIFLKAVNFKHSVGYNREL